MLFCHWPKCHWVFKRLAKAVIRLWVCAGWSEALLVAHTTLLQISCCGSYNLNEMLKQDLNRNSKTFPFPIIQGVILSTVYSSNMIFPNKWKIWMTKYEIDAFVWSVFVCLLFVSLRPINNLSVIKGRVFLGWTSTKLGLMFLLKDITQWRRWGSNPWPFRLESSTLPLSNCAPVCSESLGLIITLVSTHWIGGNPKSSWLLTNMD